MATYKQPIISNEYLWKTEPEKKILLFITQGAHVSGVAMKILEDKEPLIIEQLKRMVDGLKPSIGEVLSVQERYVFIVSRKHYSSKHDLDLVKKALSTLKGNYKIASEDFPAIVDLVSKEFLQVEIKAATWKQEYLLGHEEIEWTPPALTNLTLDL
jgi:hypothetical protein